LTCKKIVFYSAATLKQLPVNSTRRRLRVTIWPAELERRKSEIVSIARRGEVHVLSYRGFAAKGAHVLEHRRPDLVEKEMAGKLFIAVLYGFSAFFPLPL